MLNYKDWSWSAYTKPMHYTGHLLIKKCKQVTTCFLMWYSNEPATTSLITYTDIKKNYKSMSVSPLKNTQNKLIRIEILQMKLWNVIPIHTIAHHCYRIRYTRLLATYCWPVSKYQIISFQEEATIKLIK